MKDELEWQLAKRMIISLEEQIKMNREAHKWWQRLSPTYAAGQSQLKEHLLKYKIRFIQNAPIEMINEVE